MLSYGIGGEGGTFGATGGGDVWGGGIGGNEL